VRTWTLRRRFLVSAGATTVVLAVLTLLVVTGFNRVGRAQARVSGTLFAVVTGSATLFNAYLNEETGIRGYALTGASAFLAPYRDGLGTEARVNPDLDRLVSGEAGLRTRLADLRAAARAWQQQFAGPVMAQVRSHGPDSVTVNQQALGKTLFDTVRGSYAEYQQAVAAVRGDAVRTVDRQRTVLLVSFLALALMVVAAGTLLGTALRRWILDPLDGVAADARAVAEGELEHPVATGGPPELRRLGSDVERMRRRIVADYAAAVAARRTVEEQADALARQAQDLRRSNDELERFAYVASHDLQEPLRKVASFTELLQRRYAGRLDDRADTYIEYAVDGAHRMQQLINDLLAFSRVGRTGDPLTTVTLGDAADGALRNLSAAIEATGATVTVEALPTVSGDRGLLTAVFQNLIGNAVKFHRPGVPPTVRVHAQPTADGGYRIDVEDDGIGIEPQYAERVFVIFSRLGRREDHPGSGIGLALARKIVEYHGGRIWIAARPDPGTHPGATVSFTLPLRPGTVTADRTKETG
jgi:signal transduction histidine kinase